MSEHLALTPHLHDAGYEDKIRKTFLGQAHFAGSGPFGRTCRECVFFHLTNYAGKPVHGYYALSNKEKAGLLKKHRCNYRIPHKAKRRIPHDAAACRFFEPADVPPPVQKIDDSDAPELDGDEDL